MTDVEVVLLGGGGVHDHVIGRRWGPTFHDSELGDPSLASFRKRAAPEPESEAAQDHDSGVCEEYDTIRPDSAFGADSSMEGDPLEGPKHELPRTRN